MSRPRKTLYLIDGHAQIYRAYYAPFGSLTSPAGEPTRAVHVFMQMVLGLLRDKKPDYLAMVMDVSDETVFRTDVDPTYKAHREPPPEDLPPQIDRIVSILQAIKLPILRRQGFEADDILATLCRRLAGQDLDLVLVSRDKDLDQLLSDRVRMYDPQKDVVLDAASVLREKGYRVDQAVEAQMLMGDSTDNVKGVDGVGPKKAAQLLGQYGNLETILAHVEDLSPKLRENLIAFRSRMDTVRKLVTLRDDVDIDFDLDQADASCLNLPAAVPIFRDLGLNRLLERVTAEGPAAEGAASSSEKSDASAQGLLLSIDQSAADYRLIDTEPALADLARQLARQPAFAFDTETTGLVPADADLVGMSFSFQPDTGWYVAVRGAGPTVSADAVRRHLGPILADSRIRKCGHNVKFDLGVMKTFGLKIAGVDFDSMLASFVLDSSRRSHGIDALALELFNYRKIATTELIGRGKSQIRFDELPPSRVCPYAAEDADIAWRLRGTLERQMTDAELTALFRELEMPLVEVLADMEHRGVAIDGDLLARLSGQMADRLAELEGHIHKQAGRIFNLNSTQQLAEILFDVRKLRVVRRTKTGRSTDAEVLETLAAETNDPIPRLLLEYRELAKLKGTYVDALPEMVCARTGRIHPSYHQTGAVTGRLSCSDPNLQNIPIRTEAGAQIRRAFVPGLGDHVLLKADYSQIELRVLAHFCGDKNLAAAFREDRDIHAFVAAQLEGVPLDQVTKEQRAGAKTVNFGIIYGQSAFGLARQTGMSVGMAKEFIDRYFQRYPKIRGFLDSCVQHARRHGYVKTLLGRRRTIADIDSRNQTARNAAERFAVNTVVQGTAADLIKKAMINIHRRIRAEGRPSRMLIQVHDELVFDVPTNAAQAEGAMIAEEMAGAMRLDVPIRVDVAWGHNWLDVQPPR